jgi:hypothetical protein
MGNSVNILNGGVDPLGNPYPGVPVQRNLSGWGKFVSILGGIAGAIIPGIGGIIGGRVGGAVGQIGGYGEYSGLSMINEQRRLFEQEMMETRAMQAQARVENSAMIRLQQENNSQAQQFALVTNLLKSRHDGEMAAVQNLKS